MGSKAIYSEVVDLILNIDYFKNEIDRAAVDLTGLKSKIEQSKTWEIKLATNSYKASIDEAIQLERELKRSIEASNRALQERKNVAAGLLTPGESKSLFDKIRMSGKSDYIAASGVNVPKSQAAADEINRQLQAQDALDAANKRYADAKTNRERAAAKATVDRLNKERELEASNALSRENNDRLLADAKRTRRRQDEAANDAAARKQRADDEARRRGQLSAIEQTREAQARALAMEEIASQKRMRNIMSVVEGNREIHSRMLANEASQERMNRLAIRHASIIKGSMGYSVGSTLAQGKVGAAFTGAAGASFLMGANSLGGMFYMMERMSYATGIGQQKLGGFLEKLGLVKMEGAGAEASIARLGGNIMKLGGIAAVAAAPLGAMFAGNKLDRAVADMSTLLADVSVKGQQFSDMMNAAAGSAARVGESFGYGLVDTVNSFKTALSTGINADQLEQFGIVAATVARGLGATLEQSTSILTTFKDAFAGTVQDTVEYSDVLFNAINVGKFNVSQLSANIGRVAVTAAEAGVGFKDMMAALATLNRVGMSTSQAITSLNQLIVGITNPSDAAAKVMDRLGIAYGGAALKGRTLMEVIDDMKAKIGDNPSLWGDVLREERARRGGIGLAANPDLWRGEVSVEIEKQGTALEAANRAMDTFSMNFGKIFQTIWDVIQLVGRDLLQVANDVFFQGGPLSADTMVTLKTLLETIGLVVKEVGIILITGLGAVYHVIKNIGAAIGAVSYMVRGELTKGFLLFTKSVENSAIGVASGLVSMMTTIGTSADRVGANFAGMIPDDTIKKKAASVKESVASMFGDDALSAIDKLAEKTKSVFAKIAEDIEKARFQAAKFEWEQANPKSATKSSGSYRFSDAEMGLLSKVSIGQSIRDQHPNTWMDAARGGKSDFEKGVIKDKIKAAGGMDPEDPETKILLDALNARMAKFQETAGFEAAKAYAKAYREKMEADLGKEFPGMFPKQPKEGDVPSRIPSSAGKPLKDLMDLLDALKSGKMPSTTATRPSGYSFGGATTPSVTATETVTTEMTPEEAVQKAKELYRRIEEEYKKHKDKLTEADRKYLEDYLIVAGAGIKDAEKKLFDEKIKEYKKEYDFQLKIYNLKMNLIDKERKKLEEVRKESEARMEKFKEIVQDSFSKNRPGAARREFKDQAESEIEKAKRATDPEKIGRLLDSAAKLLDKMVSTGDAPERAERDRVELTKIMMKIQEDADRKTENAKKNLNERERNAASSRDTALIGNPVAEAAVKEAQRIMKDAVAIAAKHGLTVNGELMSTVEVNVDANIPVGAMRDAVVDTVKSEMTRMWQKMLNASRPKSDEPGGNDEPVGAP